MKKFLLTVICGLMTGLAVCGTFHMTTQAASDNTDIENEIDELIQNGEFDSDSLTQEQLDYIYEKYDGDPQAITELQKQSDANSELSVSSVDTSNYSHDSQFDNYDVINGIDISKWQGTIDWEAVKASGIDFALIRVAYRGYGDSGSLGIDTMYEENLQGAIDAGLDVGVYIYSQAITVAEAQEEADYILSLIKGYKINLPVVLDYEYAGTGVGRLYNAYLSVTEATNICNAFCARVEESNYTAMVYANKSMLTSSLNAASIVNNYPIWLAQYPAYDSATESIHATYEGTYSYWQYTSSGSVDGISGNVDMNFRYVKKPSTVKNLKCTTSTITSITLSWDRVPYVYGYRIYRLNKETGSYEQVGSTVGASNTTYVDKDLEINSVYTYKVRAFYKLAEGNYYGSYSDELSAVSADKVVTSLKISKKTESALTLKWTALTEVSGYQILRLDASTGKYKAVGYVTDASTNKYTDSELECGTTYYYKVRAYYEENGTKVYFDSSKEVSGTTLPGQVTGLAYTSTKKAITLSWKSQENVSGYKIYVKNSNSKWEKISTVKGADNTSYTYTGLESNTVYEFSIIAYYVDVDGDGDTINTTRSDTLEAVTRAKVVKKYTATPVSQKAINLTWKKSSNITGYIIAIKQPGDSSWTRVATITSADTTSYTVTGLSANTEYTIRIKAYRNYNGQTIKGRGKLITVKTAPKKVANVTIKKYDSEYLLSWEAQSGVSGYYVYSYNTTTNKSTKIATIKKAKVNSCIVSTATSATIKYYVVAYNKYNGEAYKGKQSDMAEKITTSQTVKVTASTLNIRKKSNESSAVVTSVDKGTILTVKGVKSTSSGDWYYVSFKKDGKTIKGYVSSAYVKIIIE